MAKITGKGSTGGATLDADIELARQERAKRAQARKATAQAVEEEGEEETQETPVTGGKAQLAAALAALAKAGVKGDALTAAKRALVREYVDKLQGVQSIQTEDDPENPGYILLTVVSRIPEVNGMPERGPKGGKPALFNTRAHIEHAGKVFTFTQGCFLYESRGGEAPEVMAEI